MTDMSVCLRNFLLICLSAFSVPAQNSYIYNYRSGVNQIIGYSVDSTGRFTPLPGSPFPTKPKGPIDGFVSATPLSLLRTGNYLYVANDSVGSISAYAIEPLSGMLTPIPGSPFPTEVRTQSSLSASPDGQFLYQGFLQFNHGNPGGQSLIAAFRINPNGALTKVSGSPFTIPGGLFHIQVSPDGKLLAVAQWFNYTIAMLWINADGTLTPLPNSPFYLEGFQPIIKVLFNSTSTRLFTFNGGNLIDAFDVGADGSLAHKSTVGVLSSFNTPTDFLLTPNDQYLYVGFFGDIGAVKVEADGTLTRLSGSPFANSGKGRAVGLMTDRTGSILYVTNLDDYISLFKIDRSGSLTPLPSSPVFGTPPETNYLAVFPTPQSGLKITGVEVSGKKLFVIGENFDDEAVILVNGIEQNTKSDVDNWTTSLIGKKAGKKIKAGQTAIIQVRNSSGRLSPEFSYTRPE